jgi:peptidoglycan/xylan/chitin deacetylase (PgdA/CDA1 family)
MSTIGYTQAQAREPRAASRIYLTFDDGPDADWTPRILDVLAQAEVRATFFVIGDAARREPSLLRRAAAQGHAIGNHTKSHRHPWSMSTSSARNEVREGAAIIEDILGARAAWYRAPHGRNRRCMTEAAQECGQSVVDWHLSAVDWGPLGKAARIKQRLDRAQAGNILLMHDGRNRHNRPDELMQVLPEYLQSLAQRGLQTSALPVHA